MKLEYKILTVLLIIMTLLTIISSINNTTTISIVGSSSVQPVCEHLAEEYEEIKPNIDINVQGGGSSLGIKCTNHSIADIGMSSKEIKCENINEYEIGREAILLIVNKNNPITDLSTIQIQKIFSGEITNWNEISDKSGKINVIIREEGSGTLDSFKKIIMKNNSIKNDAIVQNSAGSIKQAVIQDENAIGFVSLIHADNTIKNLSVDGVYASKNSIINNSYKLQRPFILLINEQHNHESQEFINWIMSNESQHILDSEKIFRADNNG